MASHRIQSFVHVLTSRETQSWYNPFSAVLRSCRRSQILEHCEELTRASGCTTYVVYDAFESYITSGVVGK